MELFTQKAQQIGQSGSKLVRNLSEQCQMSKSGDKVYGECGRLGQKVRLDDNITEGYSGLPHMLVLLLTPHHSKIKSSAADLQR
jgi:hypothetical protein